MYDDPDLCSKCGGKCCQTHPCHFSPSDFIDLTYDGLKAEIEKGFISIDWWEGDANPESDDLTETFFLRVKTLRGCTVDPTWGGRCYLWTRESGCPFNYEQRPKGGRMLIPDLNNCKQLYSKQDCALEWRPYNNILYKLYEYYL